MIRVLHIVGSMHPGGMENFVMNLYRNIDRSKVQFDFITHTQSDPGYVQEIEQLGGRIYQLPRLTSNPVANLKGIKRIVKENEYVAVVRHTPNALVIPQLLAAKSGGSVAICHSHSTSNAKMTVHRIGRFMMKHSNVERFACSEEAGKWMYGNKPFRVVRNAIDLDGFSFKQLSREKIRKEFGMEDNQPVFGHIANFVACKNHTFLMDIYHDIAQRLPDARFFCLGDGDLRDGIMEKAERLGIADRVIFTGMRSDAADFMSAMDVLIFPSVYEGLPLTLIEAQASGLPILVSDTVNPGIEVTQGLVCWKSIQEPSGKWAKEAVSLLKVNPSRVCQREAIQKAGYDIHDLAKWYEEYFTGLAQGKK